MDTIRIENEGRRRFLAGFAGLSLALYLPRSDAAATATQAGGQGAGTTGATTAEFAPGAFLRVGQDGMVTVISKHLEMGQGAYTGLATLVAEELGVALSSVRVESAPADASRYKNVFWGVQGTGGSSSIANSWDQLRQAGAVARTMFVNAAAQRWSVAPAEVTISEGVVSHQPSGRKATLGAFAEAAGRQDVPKDARPKDARDYVLIGHNHGRRTDSIDKTTGKAVFTQDIHLPGMLTAMVAHPPRFGARVKSFDASKARAVKGVVEVVQIPSGVAVVARDTWSARKGREALTVEWDEGAAYKQGTTQLSAAYRELAKSAGAVALREGDSAHAINGAAKTLDASYDFPYLAHAAMEPLNCVIQFTREGCEAWFGAQMQTQDQIYLARIFGIPVDRVRIHTLYAGGSFGRRAAKHSDYVVEAAHIVKAIGKPVPVKLVWTREDDMRAGYYRPMFHHRLRAGLDAQGRLVGWHHRLVGQSLLADANPPLSGGVKNGIDRTSLEGATNLPYGIPNLTVDLHTPGDVGVPVQWLRSVGSTHTAYSTECFIDELAAMAGKDPVIWRLAMLGKHPRHAGVLRLAADKAGWGQPLAPAKTGERRGRGVAVHESFNTFVAQVAEVTVKPDGGYRVDRVVCAVDCGIVVNPDVVRAQIEGGIGYALSLAMHGAITLTEGRVDQSNFHDYQPLRIHEMPKVEVYIVPSTQNPTGIGEPGVPPLAPAVANALAAATGKRVRKLPLDAQALKA